VEPSVKVPLVADSVTWTTSDPLSSGSLVLIALPVPLEKTSEVFSTTVWGPGTLLTGGWLTERRVLSSRISTWGMKRGRPPSSERLFGFRLLRVWVLSVLRPRPRRRRQLLKSMG